MALHLKPLNTPSNLDDPLAESVSPSAIKEANETIAIASTANNAIETRYVNKWGHGTGRACEHEEKNDEVIIILILLTNTF